ncbi:hypothetical protein GOP47_0010100 [Adiantum capillus-veneris]|uniref:Uncharacterized protein n=1 Tax=Adiantum capillus-veneris TaxID=13818 RepID=A0A9D4ZG31_ADICA|nr:hypothetical protein GOP47_0010100 [Adiantum capillus-veneris]
MDSLLTLAAGNSPNANPLYEPLHSSSIAHDEHLQAAGRPHLPRSRSCSSEEELHMSDQSEECMNFPKGFLPVLLGPDYSTCYVIRTALLAHPLVAPVLHMSAREFGYAEYKGSPFRRAAGEHRHQVQRF